MVAKNQFSMLHLFLAMSIAGVGVHASATHQGWFDFIVGTSFLSSFYKSARSFIVGVYGGLLATTYLTSIYFVITVYRYLVGIPVPPGDGPFVDLVLAPQFIVVSHLPFVVLGAGTGVVIKYLLFSLRNVIRRLASHARDRASKALRIKAEP